MAKGLHCHDRKSVNFFLIDWHNILSNKLIQIKYKCSIPTRYNLNRTLLLFHLRSLRNPDHLKEFCSSSTLTSYDLCYHHLALSNRDVQPDV